MNPPPYEPSLHTRLHGGIVAVKFDASFFLKKAKKKKQNFIQVGLETNQSYAGVRKNKRNLRVVKKECFYENK
jgi:hypothetical protein